MQKHGWNDVPIVVVETEGAHSFHQAVKEDKLVYLEAITSIAKTLGALCVCKEVIPSPPPKCDCIYFCNRPLNGLKRGQLNQYLYLIKWPWMRAANLRMITEFW
jgi:hypothetical protein